MPTRRCVATMAQALVRWKKPPGFVFTLALGKKSIVNSSAGGSHAVGTFKLTTHSVLRNIHNKALILLLLINTSLAATAQAAAPGAGPKYWKWAATPPMGWNSYDAWGTSVDEKQVLANARYMQEHLLARWQGVGGPGHWPDLDMIPIGHIGIKCSIAGPDRQTRFTRNEQTMLMSLWAIAPSPLMLGANLPDLDGWTLSLLTNDEVIAVNQDPLGSPARRVAQNQGTEIWVKKLKDGSKAIGLFNRSGVAQNVQLNWSDAGLTGRQRLRDLWAHKNLGTFKGKFKVQVPSHGAVLLRADRKNVTEQKPGDGE